MKFKHPALGITAKKSLPDFFSINARLGSEDECFSHCLDRQSYDDLICRFGHLPCTVPADVGDVLTQSLQNRLHSVENFRLASHHDGEVALPSALLSPAHRRIQHVYSVIFQDVGHPLCRQR